MPSARASEFRAAMAVRPAGHAEATHKGSFLHATIVVESGRAGAHRESLSGAGKAETRTEKCSCQCVSNVQDRPPSIARESMKPGRRIAPGHSMQIEGARVSELRRICPHQTYKFCNTGGAFADGSLPLHRHQDGTANRSASGV